MCPGICRIIGGIKKTMWGRIKEIRKIITGWIKDNIFSAVLLVCIACIIILLLLIAGQKGIKYNNVIETFKISVTVLISMLGFSVSIYVFLNNTFQDRRNNNVIEKGVIDLFQKKKRKALGIRIIFSVITIVAECLAICWGENISSLLSAKPYQIEQVVYLACLGICIVLTLVNVGLLGYFTYEVINYEDGLKRMAKEERKLYENQGYYEDMNKGQFLNLVNNIEVLTERLVENHLHAKTSNAYDSNLKRAVCDGCTDSGEICNREKFAENYQKIIEYRNLLLQDKNLKDSDSVGMGDEIKGVMNRLFQLYLKSELLTGITISNLDIVQADLSKTSLSNSSLQDIRFVGKTSLKNTDFRDSTLNGIIFEEVDCENANFTDSKLMDIKFSTKMNLQRAIFTNADLSSMKVIGPDDKEGAPIGLNHANFVRANLTYLDIYNVCFDFADLSNIRLVDSKIGVSAQKKNNTSFQYANMEHADMLKCAIERSNFQNANLSKAILTYSRVKETNMAECRLCGANWAESIIGNCQLDKSYCTDLSLKGSKIMDTTFSYATMTSVDMSGATLDKVNFNDAVCRNTLWVRTNISNSKFERCVITDSRIVGETGKKTRIQKCGFNYTNFSNSAISNIEFIDCDFEDADFSNVRLINVRFTDCVNLDRVLTDGVWLSKVVCMGEKTCELKRPDQGWRYCDKERTKRLACINSRKK